MRRLLFSLKYYRKLGKRCIVCVNLDDEIEGAKIEFIQYLKFADYGIFFSKKNDNVLKIFQ